MSFLDSLSSKKNAVVGAGVTGNAVQNFLTNRGITSDLFDEKSPQAKTTVTDRYDLAIISPGWRRDNSIIEAFRNSGTELLSEIDFAWRVKSEIAPEQKWIGLTGTNGKTTTIQMVQSILDKSSVRGIACGNVGEPVISVLDTKNPYEVLALELSSFQLEWSNEAHFVAAALLNIAPDHIDWHGSFDNYAQAKMKLLHAADLAVINGDDSESVIRSTSWNGKKVFYFLDTPQSGEIGLVENLLIDRAFTGDPTIATNFAELTDIQPTVPHNVANAMAAAGLALAIGISGDEVREGLKSFVLDHHRLEVVLERDGVSWVNDSKATNPHAAAAALLSHLSSIWIAGGLAKGAEMDALIKRCAPRIKAAILIGQDAGIIAQALTNEAPHIPQYLISYDGDSANLMRAVVLQARELAQPGDTVLLAPACASMDQFKDYADRGAKFSAMVNELIAQ